MLLCVGTWVGVLSGADIKGSLSTRCAPRTKPPWSQPGPLAQLSFPEPLQSWLPPQADSRRMLLLRPTRAGRRHSRPPRALGPAGQRASPGNSAGCCFFSFFKTSLYDSMKCLLLPIAWPGQADLVELESTGPEVRVLVYDLPWRPCVTLGETLYLCGPVSPSVKRRNNCL